MWIVSSAQMGTADSSLKITAHPITSLYYQALGAQSPLYNGSQYLDYAFKLQRGHPFFNSTEFVKRIIYMDGMVFEDAVMIYDIVKD